MFKQVGKFLVAVVIIAGMAFSAYNNYALFQSVLGTDLIGVLFSAAGLVLFDLGAIGWAVYFSHGARGASQRATALVASVLCLLLTLTAASLHLMMIQDLTTVPDWAGLAAMISIIVALCINGISAYLVHITDPGTQKQIRMSGVEDVILEETYRQLEAKGKQIASEVANRVSDEMRDDAVRALLGMSKGGDNSPQPALAAPQAQPAAVMDPGALAAALAPILAAQTAAVTTVPAVLNGHSKVTTPGKS